MLHLADLLQLTRIAKGEQSFNLPKGQRKLETEQILLIHDITNILQAGNTICGPIFKTT